MKKITVYGNEVLDFVCKLSDYPEENKSNEILNSYKQLGGTENFIKSFFNGFNIQKTVTSAESIIIINTKNGNRTSMVDWKDSWNLKKPIYKTDWLHIMYLDILESINKKSMIQFKNNANIISADLCLSRHSEKEIQRMYDIFPYIDYLIISDVEADSIRNILNRPKNFIVHSPSHVYYNNNIIKNIYYRYVVNNSLGAGDVFAAAFVSNMMMNCDIKKSIKLAIIKATKHVMENQYEN